MAMAESITPSDGSTSSTIKLKPGNTFQDGSPVNSDTFINAWNWAAYAPNGAVNNYFFAADRRLQRPQPGAAEGLDQGPDADHVKTMSGLKKVSDTEFTSTLSTPQSFFPIAIGYGGFFPLPPSFFTDPPPSARSRSATVRSRSLGGDGDTGFHESVWSGYKGPTSRRSTRSSTRRTPRTPRRTPTCRPATWTS